MNPAKDVADVSISAAAGYGENQHKHILPLNPLRWGLLIPVKQIPSYSENPSIANSRHK